MKLIHAEDNKKTFQLAKENYSIDFTLIDMGSYTCGNFPVMFNEIPQDWQTMFIDIHHKEDSSKNISSNFLISNSGHLLRLTITDQNRNQRTRLFYPNDSKFSKEDMEILRGKGLSKVNGIWVQDFITNTRDTYLPTYYYDEATKFFIDENGTKFEEKTPVSNYSFAKTLTQAANQTTINYNKQLNNRTNTKSVDEIADILF